MSQHLIAFTFFAMHGREVQAYAMASSIRAFAGKFKDAPIWITVPVGHELKGDVAEKLAALNVEYVPIPAHEAIWKYPYASKPLASAAAETHAIGKTDFLVWIDRDGLVTGQPNAFLLPEGKLLGYRPTDMRNVGSPWGEPLTPFWQKIFTRFDIDEAKAFKFTSVVDEQRMYPYVNAGLLCVRPKAGILREWKADFLQHYMATELLAYAKESPVYYWLGHQALLTGTVLKMLTEDQMQLLPWGYNYPANLHHRFAPGKAVDTLDQVTSIRIDDLLSHEGWRKLFTPDDPILIWLAELLKDCESYYDTQELSPMCI